MSTAQQAIYTPGSVPLLVNMPHTATHVPESIGRRFTDAARKLPDTDWHIDRLYEFARELGAHMLMPVHSRYVVDLNRAPGNESLYPGKFTTGICPLTLFDGSPVYRDGQSPDDAEMQQRIAEYWQPYHRTLQSVIDGLKVKHAQVVLFDAHSICSRVPKLFDGVLPDLNIGTADGASADASLCAKLLACTERSPYSVVHNGRFKGGYITRHYGQPAQGVSAIQLELAQRNYMNEAHPFAYDETRASELQRSLRAILALLIEEIS